MDGSAFALPADWGRAQLRPARPEAPRPDCAAAPRLPDAPHAAVRAYDHEGGVLTWEPGEACAGAGALACDVEHAARFAGDADPGRAHPGLTLEGWVATEVLAKLTRTPVLAFLKAHGCVRPGPGEEWLVDLAAFGAAGTARVRLVRSADGRHLGGFGMGPPVTAAAERA